jgi:predicted MPP superfamily phosphohydrolase
MSREFGLLVVAPVLLGHVALTVIVTNVTHAIGLSDRGLDVLRLILVAAFSAVLAVNIGHAAAGPPETWPWFLRAYALACVATAVVGWPLSTLLIECRRVPPGISGGATEVDLLASEKKESFIGEGRHAWLLRLPRNESFRLRTAEWDVAVAGLPAAWDGLSLVHVSDLHFAPCYRRRYFEVIAAAAAAWDADIVAFTGDLVDHDDAVAWIEPVLARLRGRLGNFAILGNHDLEHRPEELRRALSHAGFDDVDGRWTTQELDGITLAVGGTSFPWGPRLDTRTAPDAEFRLVLSHTPDWFSRLARQGANLVLSGHNHAGQIRLPLTGPVFMPSLFSRRYDRGFFRSGDALLHVSQGVAGQHPIRYGGCLPEVTRLILRST